MFRLVAILICLPTLAHAGPLVAAFSAVGAAFAASPFLAFVGRIGLSMLLSAASAALSRRKQQDIKREIAAPVSRPPYRFAYGRARITGTPAPALRRGNLMYGCLIFNSRPSAGGEVRIWLDKREVTLDATDMHDFTGPGAWVTSAPFTGGYAVFWMGLGDQTAPPDAIMAEFGDPTGSDPEKLWPSDGWRGRTVLWFRFDAGGPKERPQRWPNANPLVEVLADWSRLWDPREDGSDPNDPATWGHSRNQALCLLDALRQNPVRRWGLEDLRLGSFIAAADVADQPVARHYPVGAATPEPRYSADGLIVWSGREIVDQVSPLAAAGGGDLVRVAGGLGYAPAAWSDPVLTVTDVAGGDIALDREQPGRDLPRAVRAIYTAPDRDWQEAEITPREVPGGVGVGEDGISDIRLDMVTSPTQAQRLAQIAARRLGLQRRLSLTLPPSALSLVAGARAATAFPAAARLDGLWRVESIAPGMWLSDVEGGVAMRLPTALREDAPDVYDWVPEADEEEIITADVEAEVPETTQPGAIAATTGAAVAFDTGGRDPIPRIRFAFDPVESAERYEWQFRDDAPEWQAGGWLDGEIRDLSGKVFAHLVPVKVGIEYDIRVRSQDHRGLSGWRTITGVMALGPDSDLTPPHSGAATGGAGEITGSFVAPSSTQLLSVEIWAGPSSDPGDASLMQTTPAGAGVVVPFTEGGLGADVTRHYFARARGTFDHTSTFSAGVSATTDP